MMAGRSKIYLRLFFLLLFLGMGESYLFGQEDDRKARREAKAYLQEAEEAVAENDFALAEASYRKAIAKDPGNTTARYNLGNLYYNNEKPAEAAQRFTQAAELAPGKGEKHKAFHNLGNSFMEQKNYQAAVEAYKDALRNDPTDDETRYNLALAKKMLEQEEQDQDDEGGGEDDQDQDEQDQEDQENQDQQDQEQDGDGEGENEDDSEEEGEQDEEQEGQGDEEQEDDNEGDQEQDQGDEGEQEQQQQPQQQQGKLSPEQIQSLLEAMNNEERKVQEKINAEKAKGAKVKSEKDW